MEEENILNLLSCDVKYATGSKPAKPLIRWLLHYLFHGTAIPASLWWVSWSSPFQSSWGDHNSASTGLQQIARAVIFQCTFMAKPLSAINWPSTSVSLLSCQTVFTITDKLVASQHLSQPENLWKLHMEMMSFHKAALVIDVGMIPFHVCSVSE